MHETSTMFRPINPRSSTAERICRCMSMRGTHGLHYIYIYIIYILYTCIHAWTQLHKASKCVYSGSSLGRTLYANFTSSCTNYWRKIIHLLWINKLSIYFLIDDNDSRNIRRKEAILKWFLWYTGNVRDSSNKFCHFRHQSQCVSLFNNIFM